MADTSKNNFFFLNRDGKWPGFHSSGLELRADGSLELSSLPLLAGSVSDAIRTAPIPESPAGLAIDRGGTLYFSYPDTDRVGRILGCDGAVSDVPCIGAGCGITGLSGPRGLYVPPARQAQFVVDSGNHRVLVFDLQSFELLELWGQPTPYANQPGSAPGRFDTPWTLVGDSANNVYIVDYGNRRVQKFTEIGQPDPLFAENIIASGLLAEPSDIAIRERNGAVWLFVVDASTARIVIFDANGNPVLDAQGHPRVIDDPHLTQPMGIAAVGDSLYVGDNAFGQVLRFQIGDSIEYVGAAIGYRGPVAALLLDNAGDLWVHSGSLAPCKVTARGGHSTIGTLWIDPAKPLTAGGLPVEWHRFQAFADTLPPDAHLDLYAYASNDISNPPTVVPDTADPFSDPKWQSIDYAANLDVLDLFIAPAKTPGVGPKELRGRGKYLWVGALFSGDGKASPRVRQLRAEFNYPSYVEFLPAIYRNDAGCGGFLPRLLALFESFFSGVEREIDSVARLFDPAAAPKGFLSWLAGCMGLDLDDNWDEQQQREIIARIFKLSGIRGTPEGLRECLRLFAGVDAKVEEPLLNASWWALPSSDSCCQACAESSGSSETQWQGTRNSLLGWTTMLAPASPQGAVVGTSAVLDQSSLIQDQDFGSPLFTDVAYQFSVEVYRSEVSCPDTLANIRAIVDQEKPAHTSYHLCIIDPRFRVGLQSRLGIDTVVAGQPRSLSLGVGQELGVDSVLAGPPPSLLGAQSRLGVSMRLG